MERAVARADVLPLDRVAERVPLPGASDLLELLVREGHGVGVRGLKVVRASRDTHREERQNRADANRLVPLARVLHLTELPVEAVDLLRRTRQDAVRLGMRRDVVFVRKVVGDDCFPRILREALHVEDLRAVVLDEEVAGVSDAGEAPRLADRLPPCRTVARPRRALDVAERLGDERRISPLRLPDRRKLAHRHAEQLRAEVRTGSLLVEDRETPVVGDQFQALRAHGAVPADLHIPRLQTVAGRGPRHEGDPLPVLLEDEANHVARPVGLAHVVVLTLELPELLHLVILALANRDHPKHSMPQHMARQGYCLISWHFCQPG